MKYYRTPHISFQTLDYPLPLLLPPSFVFQARTPSLMMYPHYPPSPCINPSHTTPSLPPPLPLSFVYQARTPSLMMYFDSPVLISPCPSEKEEPIIPTTYASPVHTVCDSSVYEISNHIFLLPLSRCQRTKFDRQNCTKVFYVQKTRR